MFVLRSYSRAVSHGASAALPTRFRLEDLPQLLSHHVRGIGDGESAPFVHYMLSREVSDRPGEPWVLSSVSQVQVALGTDLPELFDSLNFVVEDLLLGRHGEMQCQTRTNSFS